MAAECDSGDSALTGGGGADVAGRVGTRVIQTLQLRRLALFIRLRALSFSFFFVAVFRFFFQLPPHRIVQRPRVVGRIRRRPMFIGSTPSSNSSRIVVRTSVSVALTWSVSIAVSPLRCCTVDSLSTCTRSPSCYTGSLCWSSRLNATKCSSTIWISSTVSVLR